MTERILAGMTPQAAKAMARALRQGLAARQVALSHGECLDLLARQLGLHDWNVLAARLASAAPEGAPEPELVLPRHWSPTRHTDPRHYRLGLDPELAGTALIAARRGAMAPPPEAYGVLMQTVAAEAFRGQRLALTARLRTEEAGLGSLWMRVDRAPGLVLRFDNLMERPDTAPLRGTTGWTERRIVLDVPQEAGSLHFGVLLRGQGTVRVRDLQLLPVGAEVPPTTEQGLWLSAPANLEFAEAWGE